MGRIMSFGQDGRMVTDYDKSEHDFLRRYGRTPEEVMAENAKLRELATYALKHIVEVWCEDKGRDLYRGKPCEDCADAFSSDCPKCMPRMFDVSGIEVDA